MRGQHAETCMFFVDDSNIWIEAQRFAASGNSHMPKLEDSDSDPRLRIDVGKLVDTIRKNRTQGPSFLYGSRPPRNDSVWNAFGRFKFQTKIYDRANGREKEVDNSMAADLSSEAAELRIRAEYDPAAKQRKDNTTFVAITGDRDMMPPIKKVLESGIAVELWAWDAGISREYKKFAASPQGSGLSVNLLDWIFRGVYFTNFQSTRHRNAKQVDPGQTIVLCDFPEPGADVLKASIPEELLQLCRLFYISQSETGPEMFIEFPRVKNLEAMVGKVRELFKDTLTVLSWPVYAGRSNRERPAMLETSNMYAPLTNDGGGQYPAIVAARDDEPGPSERLDQLPGIVEHRSGSTRAEENQRLGDPDDDGGWETVTRSDPNKEHRRHMRHAQACPEGIRCRAKGECGYRHTSEEAGLFRDNPNRDFRLWKTRRCNINHCFRGKRCAYAHNKKEAWCLGCCHEGHYTEECRYRS